MFFVYLVFCALFFLVLNAFGEVYYYHNFKIDILKLEELTYFLASERVFTLSQQVCLMFLAPFFLCLIFVICCWMKDKCTKQLFRWLFLFIGFAPYLLFFPYALEYRLPGLVLALVGLTLTLMLWLVVFHIRSFEPHYIGIHLLLTAFALTAFFDIARIDQQVNLRYYAQQQEDSQEGGGEKTGYKQFIYVGKTDLFNLYYNLSERRGEVVRR